MKQLMYKTYYKIRLSSDTLVGSFKQSDKTFNTLPVGAGVSIIQVDSTVGFATSGSFVTSGITVEYTDKTYTEFLNVSGLTTSLGYGTTISSGDIAISYEKCLREASAQNIQFNKHCCKLLAHAILHLLGYEHDVSVKTKRMQLMETRVLNSVLTNRPKLINI